MLTPETARLLYQELFRIAAHPQWHVRDKLLALAALFEKVFAETTRQEQLAFSTLFARISYAGHQYHLPPSTLRMIHTFRRLAVRVRSGNNTSERELHLGIQAIAESILAFSEIPIPPKILEFFPEPGTWNFQTPEVQFYKYHARVVALADQPEQQTLIAEDEDQPGEYVRIRYQLSDRNDNFNHTIDIIRKVFGFPVTLSLIDVDIDRNGDYRPRAFVVEPDYLMDVTAVADCFRENHVQANPYVYLLKKFLPYEITPALFLGNIANFFLDRLLNEPEVSWKKLFLETFQQWPLVYAPMSDKQVKEVSDKSQKHFSNIRTMAASGFAAQQIEVEHCVLEPTFFSEIFGLQGRLDLFYKNNGRSAIVELKSGAAYRPNAYGIQRSHFTQTLLYDLLVRSVYGHQTDPAKYILYSGADIHPLRFAPSIAPEQWEALHVRNQLVALERILCKITPGQTFVRPFQRLQQDAQTPKGGFYNRDCTTFAQGYTCISDTERIYFNAFCGFIAREHWLAKAGDFQSENTRGHAALWRNDLAEKEGAFSVLAYLEISENRADQPDPVIVFRRTERTNPLANFRVGDIAVLYPLVEQTDSVMRHQVIKCTITSLNAAEVKVQLRSRQFNLKPFEGATSWNLEPDMMDMGFAAMYRNLMEWAKAPVLRRNLLLASRPPLVLPAQEGPQADPEFEKLPNPTENLTEEQLEIFNKIIASPEYFLLWGPPGTGKTSVMLRSMAAWTLANTTDNLLILAYTNRAVDEICEALESLGSIVADRYVRLGSRFSTSERFRCRLLNQQITGVQTRQELLAVLKKSRVVVSTVSSFASNEALLTIKKFQRLIVDEASQLLEPQIIGLLAQFDHFVLIGDHRQLPAVTAQKPEYTRVDCPELNSLGLTDLRDSYFERLFRQCQQNNWHWAYGKLSCQGRMHADIMDFPNRHFYNGFLQTLPTTSTGARHQHNPLNYTNVSEGLPFAEIMAQQRVVFLPNKSNSASPWQKNSAEEAQMVVQLVDFFKNLYTANGIAWQPATSLGIITPWRAQIAQLRASLAADGHNPDELTIDTVERYQGGARDIIIISCCVHSEAQLSSLVSLSAEGVDRKLNVALTRARQHVVMLGNAEVLRHDARYQAFIDSYTARALEATS